MGLAALLCEIIKDKNDKVRKKAVASLGEFMFYAATQLDDESADAIWEIPQVANLTIINSLNAKEEETARFYACKTIENITAQSISAGCNFATLDVAAHLLNIYHTTKNE
jgi:serine/threonine-protein kinase ULK4